MSDTYIARPHQGWEFTTCPSNIGRFLDHFKVSVIEISDKLNGYVNSRHADPMVRTSASRDMMRRGAIVLTTIGLGRCYMEPFYYL